MSNYVRKIIVLKGEKKFENERAVLRFEKNGNKVKYELASETDAFSQAKLFAYDGNDEELFTDTNNYCSLNLSQGISAGLFLNDKIIAFGSGGKAPVNKQTLEKMFLTANIIFGNDSVFENNLKSHSNTYDDDAISDVNYFDNRLISEDLNDKKQNDKYDETQKFNQSQTKTNGGDKATLLDETIANACKNQRQNVNNNSNLPFFETAKAELTNLFLRGTKDDELSRVVPFSRWVRINYTVKQFYIVGIIEQNNCPRYICYGIPGIYGEPPEKLKEYSSFIPKSLFDTSRGGYYMMFQSAQNGEKIIPKIDAFGY